MDPKVRAGSGHINRYQVGMRQEVEMQLESSSRSNRIGATKPELRIMEWSKDRSRITSITPKQTCLFFAGADARKCGFKIFCLHFPSCLCLPTSRDWHTKPRPYLSPVCARVDCSCIYYLLGQSDLQAPKLGSHSTFSHASYENLAKGDWQRKKVLLLLGSLSNFPNFFFFTLEHIYHCLFSSSW